MTRPKPIRMPSGAKLYPVAKLKRYARNPREHSEAEIRELAALIAGNGWTNPIQIDARGNMVAGHKRLAAAELLGLKQVPVVVLRGAAARDRRRLVIADNKVGLRGRWNEQLLHDELQAELKAGGDLRLTGFDEEELKALTERLEPPPLPDPPGDRTPRAGRFAHTLNFDNEEQLEQWHNFLAWLRDRDYGREASTGARVIQFVAEARGGRRSGRAKR